MLSCPPADQLQHLLDDALPAALERDVQSHLESCPGCQQALERLAAAGPSWDRAARHLASQGEVASPALAEVVADLQANAATPGSPTGSTTRAEHFAALDEFAYLAPPARPGQLGRLGYYQILEVVGRGGMGVVFRAIDERLQRSVALKVLSPQYAASASARVRFQREAKAAARISHDHVVPIYSVEETHGIPYLVMPLVVGQSLQERIDRRGPLDVSDILRIGAQIAAGLAAAHVQGLVHRDIKPANILLESVVRSPSSAVKGGESTAALPSTTDHEPRTTDYRVKITDFGLARAVDDASITQSGVITGTPMFMAPEQARGEMLDQRADLFSLGSVLYMMATGRPPFGAGGTHAVIHRIITDTPRPMVELNPDIPDWLDAIVAKLHAKDPADRFQSAQEVADLLHRHLAYLEEPRRVPRPCRVEVPAGPLELLLEQTNTVRRIMQHGGIVAGFALSALSLLTMLLVGGSAPAVLALLLGILILTVVLQLRQHWQVRYRGHNIRVESHYLRLLSASPTMLFIDGVRVARGGLGAHSELRGRIPDGEATGDEIVVRCDAGLMTFRCRIFVKRRVVRTTRSERRSTRRPVTSARTVVAVVIGSLFLLTSCGVLGMLFGGAITAALAALFLVQRADDAVLRRAPVAVQPAVPIANARDPFADWGNIVNPLHDCRFDVKQGRLIVTVPGGTPHELSALPERNRDAPRVLQWIEGDFNMQVKIADRVRPGGIAAVPGAVPLFAAGLVVWFDNMNFTHLQRGADDALAGLPYTGAQWILDGKIKLSLRRPPDTKPYLKIERRGHKLNLLTSADGRWWERMHQIDGPVLPASAQVGVYAVNATTQDFTAAFEEYRVTPLRK
jgi:eukaryotic-like serine/threonine-protein kinase